MIFCIDLWSFTWTTGNRISYNMYVQQIVLIGFIEKFIVFYGFNDFCTRFCLWFWSISIHPFASDIQELPRFILEFFVPELGKSIHQSSGIWIKSNRAISIASLAPKFVRVDKWMIGFWTGYSKQWTSCHDNILSCLKLSRIALRLCKRNRSMSRLVSFMGVSSSWNFDRKVLGMNWSLELQGWKLNKWFHLNCSAAIFDK